MSAGKDLSEFVYTRTYARWRDDLGRREKWSETVERYVEWVTKNKPVPESIKEGMKKNLLEKGVLPSMRALWSAGPSADRENVGIYNCSFLPIDCVRAFSEGLYILMHGTGVGYSVESKFVNNLPVVSDLDNNMTGLEVCVEDSTQGWAESLHSILSYLWKGGESIFLDMSKVRPKNALLKTKGGRSSGPEPFVQAVDFARTLISQARGRKLTTLECHDLMCQIASVVVVGGVRRAAMISFSDVEDEGMRHAKNWRRGSFPVIRYMANNSAFYESRPSKDTFWAEWNALAESGSGERGFSIDNWWRRADRPKGSTRSNPCHEIGLRYKETNDPWEGKEGGGQFCNLSAVVMRAHDTLDTLKEKVKIAVWIGALQATFTKFSFLRPAWSQLCNEDRLLGVDITGQCDNPSISTNWDAMRELNEFGREVAREAVSVLGINYPAAIFCGKPSGNSSQFVDCASGFHKRHSKYYVRHVRVSAGDPICQMLRDQGIELHKENGQEDRADSDVDTWVVGFPVKSPDGALTRDDETAIEQMNRYLGIMRSWCSKKGHNQSATIYVKDDEWTQVGEWLWEHFDEVVGLSFLPYDGGLYRLAPYVEIDEARFNELMSEWTPIDFSLLEKYEREDRGQGSQELACTAGGCEI